MNINKLYEVALGYKCNMPDIDCNHNCNKCDDYLPNRFTAEKQLELIKWLGMGRIVEFDFRTDINKWLSSCCTKEDGWTFSEHKDFSQALAGLILELWNDLSDNQREEVKGILG